MFLTHPSIFPWDAMILILLIGSALIALISFIALRRARKTSRIFRCFLGAFGVLGALVFLTVLYGSFIEPKIVMTREFAIDFPTEKSLTIAVIADTHLGPYKDEEFLKRVVASANAAVPDIVLLGGDYFFTEVLPNEALEPLKDLRASIGVYAVIGNHDAGIIRNSQGAHDGRSRAKNIEQLFDSWGFTTLRSDWTRVRIGAEEIAVVGIDDIWTVDTDVQALMNRVPDGLPTLLLAHSPDVILNPATKRANLIVAGHTHGGQVRLPFIGPIGRIPTKLGQAYDQGIFRIDDDTELAITRGVGESSARARLFAWPEVMVLKTRARE